jgi:hypothetical protein
MTSTRSFEANKNPLTINMIRYTERSSSIKKSLFLVKNDAFKQQIILIGMAKIHFQEFILREGEVVLISNSQKSYNKL